MYEHITEAKYDWYFTFGFGHRYPNCFIVINDTYQNARNTMVARFGLKWSMQYSQEEWYDKDGVSQQKQFNLTQIT